MYWELFSIVGIGLVRCGIYGFKYFPVIDDWIQYGAYQCVPNLFERWFIGAGLYYTRPLAGLMDLYVWSKIGMSLSFFIITILHGVSCWLFLRFFRKEGYSVGLGFVSIYMLLPINSEGTIWLSASTRIVFSLFLISLSLNLLENHKGWFRVVNLLSLFFYEQTAIVSIVLAIFFAGKDRIIPIVNGLIFMLYYIMFSSFGGFGGRSTMDVPNFAKLKSFACDFADGLFIQHWQLIKNGFLRGFNVLMIFAVVLITVMVLKYVKSDKGKSGLLLGAVSFILPFAPYLVVTQPLSFRAFMPSLVGLGLIADTLIKSYGAMRIIVALLMPVFLFCGFSEVSDYRNVSLADKQVATELIKTRADSFKYNPYPVECNAYYGQHITSITESDWATTGCIRYLTGNADYPILKKE